MPVGPLNLDEFGIFIRQATDGYSVHYVLYKQRSPSAEFAKSQNILAAKVADPEAAPASDLDIEDYRISATKTNLKDEINLAIDTFLA